MAVFRTRGYAVKRIGAWAVTMMLLAAAARASGWSALPPLPDLREGAVAGCRGDVLVAGGHDAWGMDQNNAYRWSQGAGWSSGPAMSETRWCAAGATLGGSTYCMGGFGDLFVHDGDPIATAERFDWSSGAWSPIAAMPGPRARTGAAAVNGVIVVAGGEELFGTKASQAWRYDPAADAWSAIAPLPTPRTGTAVAAWSGKVYVLGGSRTGAPVTTVEVWDPASDSWSPGPALPEALMRSGATAFDGRLWVVGGIDAGLAATAHVWSLGSDGWRAESALPAALSACAVAADSARLVVAGGNDGSATSALAFAMDATPPPPPPPPPAHDTLAADVTFAPASLNLASSGNWVKVAVQGRGWSVDSLDAASFRVMGAAADPAWAPEAGDANADGVPDVTFRVVREAFQGLNSGENSVCVSARTRSGTPVAGCGDLRVIGGTTLKPNGHRTPRPSIRPVPGGVAVRLDQPEMARVEVIDIQGRTIAVLANRVLPAGESMHVWNTGGAAPGLYFARVRLPNTEGMTKLVRMH